MKCGGWGVKQTQSMELLGWFQVLYPRALWLTKARLSTIEGCPVFGRWPQRHHGTLPASSVFENYYSNNNNNNWDCLSVKKRRIKRECCLSQPGCINDNLACDSVRLYQVTEIRPDRAQPTWLWARPSVCTGAGVPAHLGPWDNRPFVSLSFMQRSFKYFSWSQTENHF